MGRDSCILSLTHRGGGLPPWPPPEQNPPRWFPQTIGFQVERPRYPRKRGLSRFVGAQLAGKLLVSPSVLGLALLGARPGCPHPAAGRGWGSTRRQAARFAFRARPRSARRSPRLPAPGGPEGVGAQLAGQLL